MILLTKTDRPQILNFLLCWVLLLSSFVIPEAMTVWDQPQWFTSKGLGKIAIFILLATLLIASINSLLSRIIIGLLWFLEFIQLYHYQFFRRHFSGADLALGLIEYKDVAGSLFGMWKMFLPAMAATLTSAVLLLLLWKYAKKVSSKTTFAVIALIILSVNAYKTAGKSLDKTEPEHRNLAIYNALNSTVVFFTKFLFTDLEPPTKFLEYEVTLSEPEIKPNIIFYIGESLNPHHLSNFNYKRETSPELLSLQKKYQGKSKIIFSAGVYTRVSIPMLMAVVREPGNTGRYRSGNGHLVSTAKKQGYKTLLHSNQTLDFMSSVSVIEDYDIFTDWQINRDFNEDNFVDYLSALYINDNEKPLFWVLNSRAPHSPYAEHIRPQTAKYSLRQTNDDSQNISNQYDDALRAADNVMSGALKVVLAKTSRPTLVIITSDHGQLVNRNGEFGHGRLEKAVAEVPLISFMVNWPESLKQPQLDCTGNHYQLGLSILKVLGANMINPNQTDESYYINGTNLYGRGKTLKYESPPCSSNITIPLSSK